MSTGLRGIRPDLRSRFYRAAASVASAAATASGVPDVHPDAFERQPEQAPVHADAVEQQREREGAARRIGEQRRREHGRAGIDERHHLVLAASPQAAVRQHGEIAAADIADAVCRRCEEQQGIHRRRIKGSSKPHEIGLHAVEPNGVGIGEEERRLAKLRQRLGDTAAGAEQRPALVGDHDLRARARRKMPLQRVGEMVHVDHRALDAGVGQPVERVVDQRFAAERDQRFGDVAVVRPHPRAQPRRQHDCPLRYHRPPVTLRLTRFRHYSPSRRRTLAAYQARSGASAGCASDRCRYAHSRGM